MFTFLLLTSATLFQLAAPQTKADQKPLKEVQAKAEAGDAASELELGLRYTRGEGAAKDEGQAVKWFRKAAEQNYAEVQYTLGVCYAQGRRRRQGSGGSGEVVSQSCRAEFRRSSIQSRFLL